MPTSPPPASGPRSASSALLLAQARWIEGMWFALGALVLGSVGLAAASSLSLGGSLMACVGGGTLGGLIGIWGGRSHTRHLRFEAWRAELHHRPLA